MSIGLTHRIVWNHQRNFLSPVVLGYRGRKFFLISCTAMLLISVSAETLESSLEDSSSPAGMSQDVNYLHGRQASADGRFEAAIRHLLQTPQTDSMNADVY